MTRIITRLIKGAILGALLSPATLFALGLGEIHPNSALSQPFDAEIDLVSPTADELGTLKIGIASADIYRQLRLDRPAFLSTFVFKVVPIGNGRVVVRVTSTRPVTEPVVVMQVEATWAGSRAVREYTVFLDPPVFMPVQPAPSTSVTREEPQTVTAPPNDQVRSTGVIERATEPAAVVPPPTAQATPQPTQVPPPTAQSEPAPERVTTTPVEPAAVPSPSQPIATPTQEPTLAGDNYEVQKRDSLWRIANRIRPGTPQMINQTMVALYRANPSAFVGNNINRLRAGVVLRIPGDEQLLGVDVREANAEVARQYNEWRDQTGALVADTGRLKLVPPVEPVEPPTAETKPTKQDAAAKSAADKAKADADSKAKAAADAQAQSDAEAKRLLELKNAELARMQREREEQAAAEAARKNAAESKGAEVPTQAEQPAPAAETQPPPPEVKPTPKPVVVPPPPEPSFLDQFGDLPWTGILIALAALLVGGGWIFFSRRRQPQTMQFPMPADAGGVPTMTPADFDAAMNRDRTSVRNDPRNDSNDDGDQSAFEDPRTVQVPAISEDDAPRPSPRAERTAELPRTSARNADDTMSSETALHVVDQQDALAEADFHMAYGLYDQAADLVKIAIQREPSRRDLKFKLLEIFFVWGNKDSFLDAARDLYKTRESGPPGEWDRILVMGKQIAPESPMFKGGARSIGDMIDVNLEGGENRVDIDLFAAPETSGDSGGNLDFEIGNTGKRSKPSKLDFLLDETANRKPSADLDDTREMDSNARTQETPTIESPMLDATAEHQQPMMRSSTRVAEQTIRERTVGLSFDKNDNLVPSSDQTAELSIDDLGLEVGGLEITGSLDQTTALRDHDQIGDDELTRIARAVPSPQKSSRPSSLEPTMEVPAVTMDQPVKRSGNGAHDEDDVSISTIYLEQLEGEPGGELDSGKSGDNTHMLAPDELDVDLARLQAESRALDDDTIRRKARIKVAEEPTAEMPAHRPAADLAPTVEQPRPKMDRAELVATTQLPEMEPVTMSEVGTKLDLARAYMDMGDPDGARSILEEVLGEGNSGQRSEAQRLLDSIR